MKITYYNEDIPKWLKPHMNMFCKCGAPMADDGPVGYDGVMKLTQRYCMDPTCPYHMAEKIQALAKYFNISGVGPETGLELAKCYKMQNHLEALRIWFNDPPEVYLYEVAELSYVYGVKGQWKDLLAGYTSFEEFYANEYNIPDFAFLNQKYLMQCEKFFRIRQDKIQTAVLRVMITGSIHGFSSRQEFLAAINERYKDYFRIEDNKKTVRDTYCLIKEPESVDYSKTQIAVSHGIPVMSSQYFLALLEAMKGELDKDEDSGVH